MKIMEDIHRYIDGQMDKHLEDLIDLARMPSISVEKRGTEKCAGLIMKRMAKMGFSIVRSFNKSGNPIVYGEYPCVEDKERRTLLLYGAYDSNPVEEGKWTSSPFEGKVIDKAGIGKCLVARGVNNKMKVVGILNAIDSLLHVLEDVPVNLIVIFDGEEEMFSPSLPFFIDEFKQNLTKADSLYMPFSSQNARGIARVQLGYKGVLYVELACLGEKWGRGPTEGEIHSMHRAAVDNPIWHLTHALASMTSADGNRVSIEGFYDDIIEPDDEFMELVRALARQFDVNSYKKGVNVEKLIDDETEPLDVLKRLFFTSQLNIDGIYGGYIGPGPEAVIPSEARAKLDIRLIPNQQPEEMLKLVRTHLGNNGFNDITVENLASVASCRTSIKEDIAQSLILAYQSTGTEFQIWPSSIATIPIYLFRGPPLNLPFATGNVGFGGHTHGSDEFFVIEGKGPIQGMGDYEKVIASVILEYSKS